MIDKLKSALLPFNVTLPEVRTKLKSIGKRDYARRLNSSGRPTVHYNYCYFAMASLLLKDVRNILEIGTGSGRSTLVFATLFPEAIVYTIDVPKDDPDYQRSWEPRSCKIRAEIKRNLNQPNIRSHKINSFFLPTLDLPLQFEIIYVDGGHEYPAVAWDVMYAYNRMSEGGFLFVHDYNEIDPELPHVSEMVNWMEAQVEEKIFRLPEYANPEFANKKMACLVEGQRE